MRDSRGRSDAEPQVAAEAPDDKKPSADVAAAHEEPSVGAEVVEPPEDRDRLEAVWLLSTHTLALPSA